MDGSSYSALYERCNIGSMQMKQNNTVGSVVMLFVTYHEWNLTGRSAILLKAWPVSPFINPAKYCHITISKKHTLLYPSLKPHNTPPGKAFVAHTVPKHNSGDYSSTLQYKNYIYFQIQIAILIIVPTQKSNSSYIKHTCQRCMLSGFNEPIKLAYCIFTCWIKFS